MSAGPGTRPPQVWAGGDAAAAPAGSAPSRIAVRALVALGLASLAASVVIELGDLHPTAEIATGATASAALLLAMAFSRGTDTRVLQRRGQLLIGAGLAALLVVAALWQLTEHAAPRVLLLLIPVALLFATAGLAVREAGTQRRQARARELRARIDGEEAERRRWVRELHDDTLQELAAVMVTLGAAAGGGPAAQLQGITDARELVGRQIQTLRRLIAQMRPLALDSLGLTAAIEDLGRHARDASGLDIEVAAEPVPRLPGDTEIALYRIVQEALTNAIRHSGATRITIRTATHPGTLEVSITDNGGGIPDRGFTHGHGITGMHERAGAAGARLSITAAPGGGTTVRLRLPAPATPA
ncbi:sensor histidine kinase [Dactylosporangium sp. CA-139114]|uniref:sensor histidine kinase n=1 Tax=Dactylosporangium sp. CA-139114 TaxID=3239931 RepID=UPI003D96D3B7